MSQDDSTTKAFLTNSGQSVAAISATQLLQMRSKVKSELPISDLQIAELAAFSMAMVVRYALGLSAAGGQVAAIVADCLPGWVALATARHLANNGTAVTIIEQGQDQGHSSTYKTLLSAATCSCCDFHQYDSGKALGRLMSALDSYHNLILGCVAIETSDYIALNQLTLDLVEAINDHRVPVHAIELSLGINPSDGSRSAAALYAASTLSLGAPISALYDARDYIGRHYLCDISLPWSLYQQHQITSAPLFPEQPVIQLKHPEE